MKGKKAAAIAVLEYITPLISSMLEQRGRVILGIGTGSTMQHVMEAMKQAIILNHWLPHQIIGIPTSQQSQQLITFAGMILGSLSQFSNIDITIDGADEIDESGRFIIKGGGGALFMEKIVASAAEQFIVVVDQGKCNKIKGKLGISWKGGIPLAVWPDAETVVKRKLSQQIPAIYNVVTRHSQGGKIGPVISDQGHILLDLHLHSQIPLTASSDDSLKIDYFNDPEHLAASLDSIPGIIEHGLFINMASLIILGNNDGTTRYINP